VKYYNELLYDFREMRDEYTNIITKGNDLADQLRNNQARYSQDIEMIIETTEYLNNLNSILFMDSSIFKVFSFGIRGRSIEDVKYWLANRLSFNKIYVQRLEFYLEYQGEYHTASPDVLDLFLEERLLLIKNKRTIQKLIEYLEEDC